MFLKLRKFLHQPFQIQLHADIQAVVLDLQDTVAPVMMHFLIQIFVSSQVNNISIILGSEFITFM